MVIQQGHFLVFVLVNSPTMDAAFVNLSFCYHIDGTDHFASLLFFSYFENHGSFFDLSFWPWWKLRTPTSSRGVL